MAKIKNGAELHKAILAAEEAYVERVETHVRDLEADIRYLVLDIAAGTLYDAMNSAYIEEQEQDSEEEQDSEGLIDELRFEDIADATEDDFADMLNYIHDCGARDVHDRMRSKSLTYAEIKTLAEAAIAELF
jgi:hypothetical protein